MACTQTKNSWHARTQICRGNSNCGGGRQKDEISNATATKRTWGGGADFEEFQKSQVTAVSDVSPKSTIACQHYIYNEEHGGRGTIYGPRVMSCHGDRVACLACLMCGWMSANGDWRLLFVCRIVCAFVSWGAGKEEERGRNQPPRGYHEFRFNAFDKWATTSWESWLRLFRVTSIKRQSFRRLSSSTRASGRPFG